MILTSNPKSSFNKVLVDGWLIIKKITPRTASKVCTWELSTTFRKSTSMPQDSTQAFGLRRTGEKKNIKLNKNFLCIKMMLKMYIMKKGN